MWYDGTWHLKRSTDLPNLVQTTSTSFVSRNILLREISVVEPGIKKDTIELQLKG
jgi:hypothetical protein